MAEAVKAIYRFSGIHAARQVYRRLFKGAIPGVEFYLVVADIELEQQPPDCLSTTIIRQLLEVSFPACDVGLFAGSLSTSGILASSLTVCS